MLCSIFGALLIHSCPWIFKGHGQYCRKQWNWSESSIVHGWTIVHPLASINHCLKLHYDFFLCFAIKSSGRSSRALPQPDSLLAHGAPEHHFLEMFFTMGKKGSFQPSNLWWIDVSSLQLPEQVLPDTCKTVRGNFLGAASSDATEIQVQRILIFAIWTAICWCIQRIPSVWMFLDRPKWCRWSWLITLCLIPYYILLYHIISPYIPMKSNCCLLKWNLKNWMEIDRLADLRSGLSHLAHLHGRPATGLTPENAGSLGPTARPEEIRASMGLEATTSRRVFTLKWTVV